MRVIVDANVLAKMIFFADKWAREVINLVKSSKVKLISCPEIERDWASGFCQVYLKLLNNPGAIAMHQFSQSAKSIIGICELAEVVSLGVVGQYSPDPGDNKYIQCAIDGNADYIITYDGDHLIALTNKVPIYLSGRRLFYFGQKNTAYLLAARLMALRRSLLIQ